jgi:hypothetical protein
MANPEHVAILNEGVEVWNAWHRDLRDLSVMADLTGASLYHRDLTGVIVDSVDLTGADLHNSNLADAHCAGAYLTNTNLRQTDLRRAHLVGSDIMGANLDRSDLQDANLTSALLGYTILADVDLSGVEGLSKARHSAPSTIGIDTIYRSRGTIPEVFLRGCGVPESFITYSKSLVGKPIEFYSVFISYSTTDQDFANGLYADLQAEGVRCWFARHHVQGGKKLHDQIDEAIRVYDRLLLILSPSSMGSEWVKTEIAKARKKEVREKRRVLFPIRLCTFEALRDWECFDADTGKDSAREIREYFIPDFSNWKDHDSYHKAFQRLLSDLKAEHVTGAEV